MFYNYIFPRAKAIILPKENEVNTIIISIDDKFIEYHKNEDISKILGQLSKAKPTRIMPVQDRPMVREFYTITFLPEENGSHRSFIYMENSRLYLEQAYHGIYVIGDELWDYLP